MNVLVTMLIIILAAVTGIVIWQGIQQRRMAQQMRLEVQARSRLIRAATHELRQPLNGIVGIVSSLKNADKKPVRLRRDTAERLESSVRALDTVLSDTLEIFELSSGMLDLARDPADLRTETKILLRKINRDLLAKGSSITVTGGYLPEIWVEVDVVRLRQCLRVLIEQAISQTNHGEVTVSYRVEKVSGALHRVTFRVRDGGLGMDQHRARRFFDPSEYDENPELKGRPAAMLALNLADGIASMMGGGLAAESAIGHGTTFVFQLEAETCPPLHEPVNVKPLIQEEPLNIEEVGFEALSVLLVDDNEVNLFVLQEFIIPLNFGRVVCASGGQEAIERASAEAFDLILMDIAMPEVDGFEASRAIRDKGRSGSASIIAVSAEHMKGDDPRLSAAGIDGFVPKPVINADLFAAILKAAPHMLDQARLRGNVTQLKREA